MAVKNILNWKTIILTTMFVFVMLYSLQVLDTPDKLLDDVLVTQEGNLVVLQVKTNLPIKYENHYPKGPSDFIQVKVRSVSLTDVGRNEYMGNDSILPGFIEQIPIMDVAFEGDVPGGPYISLRFKEPVNYKIKETSDLYGIKFLIPQKTSI